MKPVSRSELIQRFRRLGLEGPFSGGKHSFMRRGPLKVRMPNPHQGDIGPTLLMEILRQAGLEKSDWLNAK